MADALFLVPLAIILSAVALFAFLWSLGSGQYVDLAGAAERVIHEDRERPLLNVSRRADMSRRDG